MDCFRRLKRIYLLFVLDLVAEKQKHLLKTKQKIVYASGQLK